MEPQVVITTPLLEGLDGEKKMSKSLGNYVGIGEPAAEQFGKLMSIPDPLMPRYFALTTGWRPDRVAEVTGALADGSLAPVAAKRLLGRTIADLYHGPGAGEAAEAEFDRVFKAGAVPTDVPGPARWPRSEFPMRLARLLAVTGLVPRTRRAGARSSQGGVRLGGGEGRRSRPRGRRPTRSTAQLLQVGKRAWARVVVGLSAAPGSASEGVEDDQGDDRRRRGSATPIDEERPAWRRRSALPMPMTSMTAARSRSPSWASSGFDPTLARCWWSTGVVALLLPRLRVRSSHGRET